jgi:glycine dehydrogenase subunit 1
MCCRKDYVRQMPGRIIGRTTDLEGKRGFALTLQAREQHIRRSKATSNICTNQGLLVTAATIYMSLMGPKGLHAVACGSHNNTRSLVSALEKVNGVRKLFDRPYFHEAVFEFDIPVNQVMQALSEQSIVGGISLEQYYPELGNTLLVCATETRTQADIKHYADSLTLISERLQADKRPAQPKMA